MHTSGETNDFRERLAILTGCISHRSVTLGKLSALTQRKKASLHTSLTRLQEDGLVAPIGYNRWRITPWGQTWFYKTLQQVQDVLVPAKESPSLPFTVQTDWRTCTCLNYRVAPERLQALLSPVFRPVLFEGTGRHKGQRFGIVSVTISSIVGIRPRGMPAIVGQNFCNVSYRAVVSFTNAAGIVRVGYEFIKSITNSQVFTTIGNILPEYKFHEFETGTIHFLQQREKQVVGVQLPHARQDIVVAYDTTNDAAASSSGMPPDSIFASRSDFDKGVIDLNDAFGHVEGDDFVHILRIDRDPWDYRFVQPSGIYVSFFQEGEYFDAQTAALDSVVHCEWIGYRWAPLIKEALLSGGSR